MQSAPATGLRNLALAVAAAGLVSPSLGLQQQQARQDEASPDSFPPDLTGSVPVKGFRLDRPFGSDDNAAKGWTLKINMTEEAGLAGNRFVVRLTPPVPPREGSLVDAQTGEWLVEDDVAATWGLKALGFNIAEFPLIEGGNALDGSCPDSVFSEQCRKDYVTAIKGHVWGHDFEDFEIPESCSGFSGPPYVQSIRANASFTADARWAWSYNTNGQSWLDFKDKTFPFIFVWRGAEGSSGGEDLTEDHIQFNCVKADTNAKTGDLLPGLSPGSGNGTVLPTTATSSTSSTATGSNTPAPTAGASLQALSKTVGVAAVMGALVLSMF